MAKQPTPALRVYEQQSAPRVASPVNARNLDVSSGPSGIAAALGRAGAVVQDFQEGQLAEERLVQQRREDDARVVVTHRMAEFRREANDLRRTVFNEAADGWRGADETYATRFGELAERYRGDTRIDTDEARALFDEQVFIFQQSAQDTVAEQREAARGQWQADTTRAAIDSGGSVLIADPDQYEAAREDALETIAGISDANMRRDTAEYMEESYARYAVAGLIQANPRAALTALSDPEAEGAVARLSPAARAQAMGQAESEIERRAARWRASVSQSRSSAEAMWELGLDAANAPSVETVRQAEGDAAALRYEAMRLQSTQFGRLSTMSAQDLRAIAGDANRRDNQRDAVLHMAERQAAAAILEQRNEDPMQYQVRNGLTEPADLVAAMNSNDWGLVNGILQSRAAAATANSERLGVAPLPLTAFEAGVVGSRVGAMPADQRGAFMRNASAWMGGDTPAYRAFAAQVFQGSPASAYAGYLTGVGGARGARDAALVLRGEDVLGGRQGEGSGAAGGGGRNRLVELPRDEDLARHWRNRVGDAYAGMGADAEGSRQSEAQAFEVYRAAYAAQVERSGGNGGSINTAYRDRAVEIATGGLMNWNGRRTVMPAYMSQQDFAAGVAAGFGRWQQLRDADPRDYTLVAVGMSERGVRYQVWNGPDDPVRSPSGVVEIEVRR